MQSLYPCTVAAVPDLLQFLQVLFTGPFLLFQGLLFLPFLFTFYVNDILPL